MWKDVLGSSETQLLQFLCGALSGLHCLNRTEDAGDHVWKLDGTQSKLTQVQTQTITLHHSSVKLLVTAGLTSGLYNLKGFFQLNNYMVLQ